MREAEVLGLQAGAERTGPLPAKGEDPLGGKEQAGQWWSGSGQGPASVRSKGGCAVWIPRTLLFVGCWGLSSRPWEPLHLGVQTEMMGPSVLAVGCLASQ